jgi:hypothetical protein
MGTFQGGSAPAMASQVCDGYSLLSQVSLKRLSLDQMTKLEFEIQKRLRASRSDTVDLNDQPGLQARNRRISRIEGAIRVLRQTIQMRRSGRI